MTEPSPVPIRPFGRRRVEAPTGAESAAFDRRAIDVAGVPEPTLMENAGRSAALLLERLYPRGEVVAFVGGGNNGGDALVLLRTLAAWGRPVAAVRVADRPGDDPVLHGRDLPTVPDVADGGDPDDLAALAGRASVLVDGVLGTGVRGAPRERQAAAIETLNSASTPVVSLDVPSGVDADTGGVPGAAARADLTVAFGWPKLGALLPPGRARAGRLVAVEIGFPPRETEPAFGARLTTPAWADAHRPRRGTDTHKHAVGSLLVLAGREGMAGAAVLAARAALRSGVGILRIASRPGNRVILQQLVPEAIFVDATDPAGLVDAVEEADALAAGPAIGTGERAAQLLERALEAAGGAPVVLDADALTLIGEGRVRELPELAAAGPVLVTPHPGEMARIAGRPTDEILGRRVEVARETASASGCTVLLKGMPSIVAPPEGPVMVDSAGTSDLATAGMGDVLTGVCGSLLAQGALPPVRTGALALHHSGRAAVRADRGPGLVPGDVISCLPEAFREEGAGTTGLDAPFVLFDQDPPR